MSSDPQVFPMEFKPIEEFKRVFFNAHPKAWKEDQGSHRQPFYGWNCFLHATKDRTGRRKRNRRIDFTRKSTARRRTASLATILTEEIRSPTRGLIPTRMKTNWWTKTSRTCALRNSRSQTSWPTLARPSPITELTLLLNARPSITTRPSTKTNLTALLPQSACRQHGCQFDSLQGYRHILWYVPREQSILLLCPNFLSSHWCLSLWQLEQHRWFKHSRWP